MKIKQFIKKYGLQIFCIGLTIFNVCAISGIALYQHKITQEYKTNITTLNKELENTQTLKAEIEQKKVYTNNELKTKLLNIEQTNNFNFMEYFDTANHEDAYNNNVQYNLVQGINTYTNTKDNTINELTPKVFNELFGIMDYNYYNVINPMNYLNTNNTSWNVCDNDFSTQSDLQSVLSYYNVQQDLTISYVGELSKNTLVSYWINTQSTKISDSGLPWEEDTTQDYYYTQTGPNANTRLLVTPHYYGLFTTPYKLRSWDELLNLLINNQTNGNILLSTMLYSHYCNTSFQNWLFDYPITKSYVYVYSFYPYTLKQAYLSNNEYAYYNNIQFYQIPNDANYTNNKEETTTTNIQDIMYNYTETLTYYNNEITKLNNKITQLQTQIKHQDTNFYTLIDGVVTAPITFLSNIFNVEILGVNIWLLISGLFSGLLVILILKKVL